MSVRYVDIIIFAKFFKIYCLFDNELDLNEYILVLHESEYSTKVFTTLGALVVFVE